MGAPPPYPPYPAYPPYPGPPPRTADRVISIVVLVFTGLFVVGSAFIGLMLLAFLDYCPPESCSVNGAVTTVMTTVGITVAVAIAGLVATVIRLRQRATAWPFAMGTLVLCGLVAVIGSFAYTHVVGY